MWVDDLDKDERRVLNKLVEILNFPPLNEFKSQAHFLELLYGRLCDIKYFTEVLNKTLFRDKVTRP